MNSAIDITSEQRKTLVDLVRQYIPGVAVWAYGSRVKWTARPNSDLDLVVFTAPDQIQLVSELKNALAESELPFLVDLHVWDEIPERFREIISGEYVVIQEQKDELRQLSPASDWRISTWGEEISLEYGKALRDYSHDKGEYRVYGSNGPIGWTGEPLAPGPGVILGRKGAYRGIQFCQKPFYVIDTAYYVVPKTELDMRWLYYAMAYYKLGEIDDGSPIPSTTRSAVYIREFEIPTPREQRNIAGILGALDDRIELNRKLNETLEAIARAIFKSWFVDFDPVRAKAEGREPEGMDADTAALFPSKFEKSEFGRIPFGWSVSTIKELACNIQYGLTTSAKAEAIGPKFLRITDIQGGKVNWNKVPYCSASEAEYDRYRLKAHDIVVARTGASTGENIYLPVVPDAVFASYLVRFQFEHPAVARLVGAFMRTTAYFDFVQNSIGGSAQPNASAQVLAGAKLVLPTPVLLRKFAEIVEPLDKKLWHNVNQSITLIDLRDTLLPRLISGKLRVPEAEAMLTAV
jgi:type I restriction enzyme S subunit